MDCSRARTKDPGDWLETCPDFSKPLAQQLTDWMLTWEPDLTGKPAFRFKEDRRNSEQ